MKKIKKLFLKKIIFKSFFKDSKTSGEIQSSKKTKLEMRKIAVDLAVFSIQVRFIPHFVPWGYSF